MHNRCWWLALFRPLGGGVGLTVDSHIFFRGEPTPGELAHEMVHVRQYQEMGMAKFLAVYFWEWLKLGRRPVSDHPLEAPAYEAQWEAEKGDTGQPFDELRTPHD